MVLLSTKTVEQSTSSPDADRTVHLIVGNILFFTNCLCTSLYVILSKRLLLIYDPLYVTAWSYNIAAIFMAITALLASSSTPVMSFLCPDCASTWGIPSGAFFALFYFIVFNSVAVYAILTWANQYATGTLVMGYSVLQPVTAAFLTFVLLMIGMFPRCSAAVIGDNNNVGSSNAACLDPPGLGAICGMVGVFAGLILVITTEPKSEECGNVLKYNKVMDDKFDSDTALQT
mmetsp:Transcript_6668/g.9749  ORF Transcript_6668/g.9749 Transcript_6668/m.9749 type:complete len:231 (-) Transcript_6668:205-897(-)